MTTHETARYLSREWCDATGKYAYLSPRWKSELQSSTRKNAKSVTKDAHLAITLDRLRELTYELEGLTNLRDELIVAALEAGGGEHQVATKARVSNTKIRNIKAKNTQ